MQDTHYAIQLTSKFTGEAIWLGSKYASRDEAKQYAEREVCQRCNRYELLPVSASAQYRGRLQGFKEGV